MRQLARVFSIEKSKTNRSNLPRLANHEALHDFTKFAQLILGSVFVLVSLLSTPVFAEIPTPEEVDKANAAQVKGWKNEAKEIENLCEDELRRNVILDDPKIWTLTLHKGDYSSEAIAIAAEHISKKGWIVRLVAVHAPTFAREITGVTIEMEAPKKSEAKTQPASSP